MRKLQLFLLAPVVVFVFSSVVVGVASAETTLLAEWLINGAGVAAETPFTDTGTFVFGESGTKIKVRCSVVIDGVLKADGVGEDTAILTSGGVVVSLTAPLLCETVSTCEASTTDIEVAPEGLPWKVLAYLSEGGEFREKTGSETWDITCLVLGVKASIECVAEPTASFELLNVTNGIEQMGVAKPLGTCPGGKNTFEVERAPENRDQSGTGTLSVSE